MTPRPRPRFEKLTCTPLEFAARLSDKNKYQSIRNGNILQTFRAIASNNLQTCQFELVCVHHTRSYSVEYEIQRTEECRESYA